jgi:hypothetical protein
MWKLLFGFDFLAPSVATRNVAAVLDARDRELAEVDSVVDRLRRHDAAARPAA